MTKASIYSDNPANGGEVKIEGGKLSALNNVGDEKIKLYTEFLQVYGGIPPRPKTYTGGHIEVISNMGGENRSITIGKEIVVFDSDNGGYVRIHSGGVERGKVIDEKYEPFLRIDTGIEIGDAISLYYGIISLKNLPVGSAGLASGTVYRTEAGVLCVKV
jgi:hypothetical protein